MAYTNSEISQLLQKQAALDTAIAEAREKETRLALIEMVQKMREYDISLHELMGRKLGEPAAALPKYRDPVTGATWSGRGREPQWIAGLDRNQFLTSRGNTDGAIQPALFQQAR
ncbi:histone family protein nucleoid-structuring protein H-NS [Caballeronia cordobensis]|uniref:Histone family protein nucleoid-structuring protein H-NS n=1 Tax=Caballeronia cordobensis TaxID=1353886 RepID=A0A158I2M5_CABCO|nr:H-NS histone family protein [Caballeronia cordobensis]SAL50290.1 histone family protein nucleoid-structuring protein H-NS [Caballeronia cordobensis]